MPELILAATPAPAEVPTIRSAAVRSTPCSVSPASRPTSQAIPASPPAPSTSALLVIATVLPNRRARGQGPAAFTARPGRFPGIPGHAAPELPPRRSHHGRGPVHATGGPAVTCPA